MTSPNKGRILVADVGGTHVRFALVDVDAADPLVESTIRRYRASEFASFADAVRRFVADGGEHPASAVIAAAGLRVDDEVRLTNLPWVISRSGIEHDFGFDAKLINDFAAQALSIALLKPADLLSVGQHAMPRFDVSASPTFAVLGPGTGLGVGALIVRDGRIVALETEGGHASLAPRDDVEMDILKRLTTRFGRVSHERVLCGSGLVNLYQTLCDIDGVAAKWTAPEDVTAHVDDDPMCARTVDRFSALLGALGGDLALTFGAWDGVFVTGGLAPHMAKAIEAGTFRARFEDKGRLSGAVKRVPTAVIVHVEAGLLGAAVSAMIDAGKFATATT
jgi:glucokinase